MWENVLNELQYLAGMLLAVVLGFLIGYERKLRFKEAGIRTHTIVRAGRKQKKEDKEGISGKKKRILVLKYPHQRLYGAGKGGNNESYGYSEKNR